MYLPYSPMDRSKPSEWIRLSNWLSDNLCDGKSGEEECNKRFDLDHIELIVVSVSFKRSTPKVYSSSCCCFVCGVSEYRPEGSGKHR